MDRKSKSQIEKEKKRKSLNNLSQRRNKKPDAVLKILWNKESSLNYLTSKCYRFGFFSCSCVR